MVRIRRRAGPDALTAPVPGALSAEFGALVGLAGPASSWPSGEVVGLEHEYRVLLGGRPVDFRTLVHELDLGPCHLDPGDPNAYRLPSGAAWTADEAEAEIALPPFGVGPGFDRMAAAAAREGRALQQRLPPPSRLEGYSTHLSVAVPDTIGDRLARLFAITFAPALMLLADRADSPGLLVRPRRGRLEVGAEFVEGARLAAVAAFLVASVRACLAHLDDPRRPLPDRLRMRIVADDHRYGWFVARDAFGADLYASGRATRLRLVNAGTRSADDHLRHCWEVAAFHLAGVEALPEKLLLEELINDGHPLPRSAVHSPSSGDLGAPRDDLTAGAFGRIARPGSRPTFDWAPVMITWSRVVLVAAAASRSRLGFLSIAGPQLGSFFALLDAGRLDDIIGLYLSCPPSGRRLDRKNFEDVGLYDDLAPRAELLPTERRAALSARLRADGRSVVLRARSLSQSGRAA